MFERVRKLAIALLLFVLPWQPLATGMPIATQDDSINLLDNAERGSDKSHYDNAGRSHHQQHSHAVAMSADNGSAPSNTTQSECPDACCFPSLAADGCSLLAVTQDHGLVIPFAALPVRWRAPDAIDHPPRGFLA
jgi:hypothetical protein